MQLRDIEYVSALAEAGSFTQAAAKLGISQPALSQAIRKLEHELGAKLFDRRSGEVLLTKAGEVFLKGGRSILSQSQSLCRRMADIVSTEAGILKIGISSFYSAYHLPRIVTYFLGRYPDIKVEIYEDISVNLEAMALDGRCDLSFVPFPLVHEKLAYKIVHLEQILLAMPPDNRMIAEIKPALSSDLPFIDLALAANEPFIYLHKRQRFTAMADDLCRQAGFAPRILLRSMNWDTVNALIGKGLGIGFVPEIVAERANLQSDRIVYCRLAGLNATRPYAAVFRSEQELSPAARNFIAAAQEVWLTAKVIARKIKEK